MEYFEIVFFVVGDVIEFDEDCFDVDCNGCFEDFVYWQVVVICGQEFGSFWVGIDVEVIVFDVQVV